MKTVAVLAAILACGALVWAQEPKQAQPPAPQAQPQPRSPVPAPAPQTETINTPSPAPAAVAGDGFLTAAQMKELLHRVWLVEYRINDLLTEVHPERWKLADATRSSFQQTLETLRTQLAALDDWRVQLDVRPESVYLGYMTFAAMDGVRPRLDGVARSIAQHENASLAAQFSQAGNQLFDLQQVLGLHLGVLLRSQDEVIRALENNLAACQNELGYALRGRATPAKPMKNVLPELKGRRRAKPEATGGAPAQKPPSKPTTKPATKK